MVYLLLRLTKSGGAILPAASARRVLASGFTTPSEYPAADRMKRAAKAAQVAVVGTLPPTLCVQRLSFMLPGLHVWFV